jgi:hypothetical protein
MEEDAEKRVRGAKTHNELFIAMSTLFVWLYTHTHIQHQHTLAHTHTITHTHGTHTTSDASLHILFIVTCVVMC